MNFMEYKAAIEHLYTSGCTMHEVEKLVRLRRNYVPTIMDQAPEDLHRLEFARWLVAHGKLTEQIGDTE